MTKLMLMALILAAFVLGLMVPLPRVYSNCPPQVTDQHLKAFSESQQAVIDKLLEYYFRDQKELEKLRAK